MFLRKLAFFLFVVAGLLAPFVACELYYRDGERLVEIFSFFGGEPEKPRKIRPIEAIEGGKQKRKLPRGKARPFSTAARSRINPRTSKVPQSERSRLAAVRLTHQLEADMKRFGMTLGNPIFCRIFKEERELEMWVCPDQRSEFSLFRIYRIHKWSGEIGPKLKEGDKQAPEGFYYVPARRMIPENTYHMGFDLGYPNRFDKFHRRTGRDILVHGKTVSHSSYAMTDETIEEIYTIAAAALNGGQPYFRVHCFPFRMRDKVMDAKIAESRENEKFWANLKLGYDFFEIMRRPPDVNVSPDGNYTFSEE